MIADSLGTGQSAAGVIVVATQIGFGIGLLFVVPLGDITARRPLVTTLLAIDAVALASSAAAPGLALLTALAVLVGTASVAVQVIIPYAATLVRAEERASTVGTLVGAILLGVVISRTFAGTVARAVGWRGVYGVAAGLMAIMALIVRRMLPAGSREVGIGFVPQIRAVWRLALAEPVLRWRSLIGAAQFAAFSSFWTTVTFLLSGQPFGYAEVKIGLFALVGAAGAGCVLAGRRLLDRYRNLRWPATGVAAALLLGSFGVLAAGTHSLLWLVLGALLMDACSQGIHVINQAVIYDLVEAARSRITTAYMTTYFIGGAVGTTVGTIAYEHDGWGGSCGVAAGFCGVALFCWLATHRHERATSASHYRTVRGAAAVPEPPVVDDGGLGSPPKAP
jgi:predicted MFS family arabinose efflux permease